MLDLALLKNSAFLRLKMSRWGNTRKGNLSDAAIADIIGDTSALTEDEKAARIEAAKRRLKLSKTLVLCAEYSAIAEFQATFARNLTRNWCNPSFLDDGIYAVKTACVEQVNAVIEAAQAQLENELVPAFLKVYADKVIEAKQALNGQFNPRDYPEPEEMAKRFAISHRFIMFSVPEGLPPEIRAAEEAKLRKSFEEAQQAIVTALWAEFQGFLDHVIDRLKPGEDGRRRKFNDTLFENLGQFIGAFNNRNLLNDAKLAELVAKAGAIVKDIGGDDNQARAGRVRDFDGLRKATRVAFEDIKVAVDKTIETLPSREFNFDE